MITRRAIQKGIQQLEYYASKCDVQALKQLKEVVANKIPESELIKNRELVTTLVHNEIPLTKFDTEAILKQRLSTYKLMGKSTHKINTLEREELRTNIAQLTYGEGAAKKEGELILLIAHPGAGKSTLVEHIAKETGAFAPDADDIKRVIPEYDQLGAVNVHEESIDILNKVLDKAAENKDNTIVQTTGTWMPYLHEICDRFSNKGFKIKCIYLHATPDKCCARAINRFENTGRFLDPFYLKSKKAEPRINFNEIINRPDIHGAEVYTNNVPYGQFPKLTEKISKVDGQLSNEQYYHKNGEIITKKQAKANKQNT